MLQDKIAVARGGGTGVWKRHWTTIGQKSRKSCHGLPHRVHLAATEFEGLRLTVLPISMEARKRKTSGVQLVQSSRNGAPSIFYIYNSQQCGNLGPKLAQCGSRATPATPVNYTLFFRRTAES